MRVICSVALIALLSACGGKRTPILDAAVMPRTDAASTPQPAPPEPTVAPKPVPYEVARVEHKHEAVVAPPRDLRGSVARVNESLLDIFFDYDRFDLTTEALGTLQRNAGLLGTLLSDFPQIKIVVEGHCDERGSAEYNLALGDRRATRAAQALRDLGIPQAKLETVSYGNEMPQCAEPVESCWRRNRRAHLAVHVEGGRRE